ncbi:serine hydrolase domain-containing protein [Cytophaga sp. FL35]|uniref:serine hydrolase domain-containing protein n=1 Tax=Cytophaga sp. FL35 TaxID=1904456 RepID=UPI0016535AE4|nr:serine hydrolase domain-containing protein [Cytophaga sp. FL35]MBC6999325.1 beta-lactamase family protein [Cytophaga sp. FL35]
MKKLTTLLLSLFCFVSIGQTPSVKKSAPLQSATSSEVGMSQERLNKIANMLEQAVDEKQIPGVVALIAKDGKIVFHEAFGMADNRSKKAMEKNTIFRIASQTKAITSTAVMMLWEEGKFKLDDPISKYIPEFKDPQILDSYSILNDTYTTRPAKNEITIRHLLTHTSGLGYGVIDGDERFKKIYKKAGITDLFTTEDISIESSVKKLAQLPLHHNPGDAYYYSEGLDVLGYFIEVISGITFDEFLRTRIFDPLGMDDTYFYLPKDKHDRLVTVQQINNGKWEKYPTTFYDTDYPKKGAQKFFSGGAGLSSTAKDYATFLQMYLNGGELNGTRILSRTTIESMMQNQSKDFFGDGTRHYGLAFGVVTPKGVAAGGWGSNGTFDWGGYFNTQYFADPEEQVIGILMKQTQGEVSDETRWKFRQMVFAAIDD